MVWTPTDEMAVSIGLARATWANEVVGNLDFLYDTPAVTVRLTTAQEVANADDHAVEWDEAAWDTTGGDLHDSGSPSAILWPYAPAVLDFNCATLWDGVPDDASKRAIFLERNGTDRLRGVQIPAVNPSEIILSGSTSVATDDYLEFVVRQLSGAPLDLQPLRTICTVSFRRPDPSA